MQMKITDFLTIKEAASHCGKSYETFFYWMDKDDFPKPIEMFGKKVFKKTDLDEYHFNDGRSKS